MVSLNSYTLYIMACELLCAVHANNHHNCELVTISSNFLCGKTEQDGFFDCVERAFHFVVSVEQLVKMVDRGWKDSDVIPSSAGSEWKSGKQYSSVVA